MNIWIDAQLSPAIAAWINRTFSDIRAQSVLALGLRDAMDHDIFEKARIENVVVMSKDHDFMNLIEKFGPPPKIIWVSCGNTSNDKMRQILTKTLDKAMQLLNAGESIVEISDAENVN